MINRLLPADIKAVAWMPLESGEFSSRFDCDARTYRYYFPRGSMNIENMKLAAGYLVGTHDFRNLCKMDVANGVTTFLREVMHVDIHQFSNDSLDNGGDPGYDMFYFELTGSAFLWHQIRCIMAVLFLVGEGKEDVMVIPDLLDVIKTPWYIYRILLLIKTFLNCNYCFLYN